MNAFWRRLIFKGLAWLIILALVLTLPGLAGLVVQAQEQLDFTNVFRATVFVASVYDIPGGRATSCVGSGTLVSAGGLILTNAHNIVDSERCQVDDIAISLTVRLGEPPVPQYFADVVEYDLGLDLAVLRITRQLDGREIAADSLRLPFVELGDSSQIGLDATMAVVGYPDLGDDAVTFSRGTILGFIAEPRGGERAWLKTSATILGTMSGGGAYDLQGRLIGIPTTAPASSPEAVLDCRRVQDTNADGLVDNRDNCIPVGGSINALRPVSLANGLVQAARLGISEGGHPYSQQVAVQQSAGEPRFGPIRFAPAVNEAGLPTTFITQMPAGSNSLYLFFDYENMRPGLIYELRTTINGATSATFSQSPALWSGGQRGLWHIGSSGQPLPNGTYEFTLFVEGLPASSALLTVGGGPATLPTFSDVVFGLQDFQGNILGTGYVLPTGNVGYARFIYRNMVPGMAWTQVWRYEGFEILRDTGEWSLGASGSTTISVQNAEQGLLPGRYRLELWAGDRLSTVADFVIAGAQEGVLASVFSNVRFSDQISGGQPAGLTGATFPATIAGLYVFFDWQQLASGTPWTYRWLVDGEVLFERAETWIGPETGGDFWLHLGADFLLPDGSYTLEVQVGDLVLLTETIPVGRGQLQVERGTETVGVRMYGQVVDAETGAGIPGVMFIVLEAEFSVEDFVWDYDEQVYDISVTDREGRFEIPRLLNYDEFYSVVIRADGYLPVNADGIDTSAELGINELEMRLEMNRDYAS